VNILDNPNGFNSNASYDIGKNAAGCGRCSVQETLNVFGHQNGLESDMHVAWTHLSVGPSAAGAPRTGQNCGGNVAGAPRNQVYVEELV